MLKPDKYNEKEMYQEATETTGSQKPWTDELGLPGSSTDTYLIPANETTSSSFFSVFPKQIINADN